MTLTKTLTKTLAWLLTLALLTSTMPLAVLASEGGEIDILTVETDATGTGMAGDGSTLNPYQISTEEELIFAAESMNTTPAERAKHYILTGDIALTEPTEEGQSNFPMIDEFSGLLDGQGYKISGLVIHVTGQQNVAFIKSNTGIIQDLVIEGASVTSQYTTGTSNAAILVASNGYGALVSGCKIIGTVKAVGSGTNETRAAGIASEHGSSAGSTAIIQDCFFSGTVDADGVSGNVMAGGIVAYTRGRVERCIAMGDLSFKPGSPSGARSAGFIAAYINAATLSNNVAYEGIINYSGELPTGNSNRDIGAIYGNTNLMLTMSGNIANENIKMKQIGSASEANITAKPNITNVTNVTTKTESELKNQATYVAMGWDFDNRWTMDASNGYPVPNYDFTYYSVSGTVTDSNNEPITDARVQLKRNGVNVGYPIMAEADGMYNIPGVVSGTGYTVEASRSTYNNVTTAAFGVTDAGIAGMDIQLVKTGPHFETGAEPVNHVELIAQYKNKDSRLMSNMHRGDWHNHPENSLAGIQASIDMGADIIDIDVHKSRDGVLFLMRDDTVNRTTNGTGNCSNLDWSYLSTLRLRQGKGGSGAAGTEEKIPTLEEAIALMAGKVMIDLDGVLSRGYGTEVYKLLVKYNWVEGGIFKSDAAPDTIQTWMESLESLPEYTIPPVFSPILSGSSAGLDTIPNAIATLQEYISKTNPTSVELIFTSDDIPIASGEFLTFARQHMRVKAVTMNDVNRTANRSDDVTGWSELIDKGFNMFMTDRGQNMVKYFAAINNTRDASKIEAQYFDSQSNVGIREKSKTGVASDYVVTGISDVSKLIYRDIDLGDIAANRVYFSVNGRTPMQIEVRLDDPANAPIATVNIDDTGGQFATIIGTIPNGVNGVTGKHDVYLSFSGGGTLELDWFGLQTSEKAPLTISGAAIEDKTYDGTTTATVSEVTFTGLQNGETLTIGTDYTATGAFDNANAGSGKTVTVAVTLTGAADNYSLANNTYDLTGQSITTDKLPQTITFAQGNQSKTYGDAAFTNAAALQGVGGTGAITYESSNPSAATVDPDTGTVTIVGAGNATITATKAECATHMQATAKYTLTVSRKTVTISADNKSARVGDPMPSFTHTVSGFVGGDALLTEPTVSSPRADMDRAGTYPITVGGGTAGENYTIARVDGTLTVSWVMPAQITLSPAYVRAVSGTAVALELVAKPAGRLYLEPTWTISGPGITGSINLLTDTVPTGILTDISFSEGNTQLTATAGNQDDGSYQIRVTTPGADGATLSTTATLDIIKAPKGEADRVRLLSNSATINPARTDGVLIPFVIEDEAGSGSLAFIREGAGVRLYRNYRGLDERGQELTGTGGRLTARVLDERSFEITANPGANVNYNGVTAVIENKDGPDIALMGTLSLSLRTWRPKISFSTAAPLNAFYSSADGPLTAAVVASAEDGSAVRVTALVPAGNNRANHPVYTADTGPNPGSGTLALLPNQRTGNYKYTATVEVEGYRPYADTGTAAPAATFRVVNDAPRLTVSPKTLTLATGIPTLAGGTLRISSSASGGRPLSDWGRVEKAGLWSTGKSPAQVGDDLALTPTDGGVSLTIPGGTAAGKYQLRLQFLGPDGARGTANAALTVRTKAMSADGSGRPTVAASPRSLTLNTGQQGVVATISLLPAAGNMELAPWEDTTGKLDEMGLYINDQDADFVTLSVKPGETLQKGRATVEFNTESGQFKSASSARVKISVTDKAPAFALSQKGRIDVSNPDSVIAVSARISNTSAMIKEVKIYDVVPPGSPFNTDTESSFFEVVEMVDELPIVGNVFHIRVNGEQADGLGSGRARRGLSFRVTLEDGTETVSWEMKNGQPRNKKAFNISPVQATPKARASKSSLTLHTSQGSLGDSLALVLSAPAFATVGSIRLADNANAAFASGSGFELRHREKDPAGRDIWELAFIDGRPPQQVDKKGKPVTLKKSHTVSVELWPEGTFAKNADGSFMARHGTKGNEFTRPAVVKVKVNVR